ncbi:MAG TPA: PEP-CTERM sorting domain-containing protein [Bryobacteraceae bacterium]|nr:PEP-CTERM sorting domain-containing protein [Bryobacteraceae bacterium]
MQYTVGSDGLVNSLTAIDWAYQTDGSAILAGDTGIPSTPEPSTAALALLAMGAAGVAALRRRREL